MTEIATKFSLFDKFTIRKIYHDADRYFPIRDIVFVLTWSKNPTDYIKKMKSRDLELAKGWGQIVTPLWIDTSWWRQKVNCTNTKWALRLIQSIPSPNAEPFKQRLASLWNERVEELTNPGLWIDRAKARAVMVWKNQWKDDRWISSRLQSIQTRNSFTDILKERWIKNGFEYAILTNKIYDIWLGVEWWAKKYKQMKWLKKTDNLRDNMDMLEIAIVDLAEAWSNEIIKANWSKWFNQVQNDIISGSEIAWAARKQIEEKIGKKISTPVSLTKTKDSDLSERD